MSKIKKCFLISYLILAVIISYLPKILAAVEFEKGEPSQIRELLLKQKQEKKKLLIEKYKKKQKEEKEKLSSKGKITTPRKQTTSLFRLQATLITGLFLLSLLTIISGFVINSKRQNK